MREILNRVPLLLMALLLQSSVVQTMGAADNGSVTFGVPQMYVHESDGTINVPVTGIGGSLTYGALIFVHNGTSDNPPTTAVMYVDYTTNSTFLASGGHGWGTTLFEDLDSITLYVSIPLLDNTNLSASRNIVLGFYNTSRALSTYPECIVTILDDDSLVTLSVPDPVANETGPRPGTFLVTRQGIITNDLTVNFTPGGSATQGTDYTLTGSGVSASSVYFPAGVDSATVTVSPINDASPEADKTVTLTLAGGYYRTNSESIGTVTIVDNDPVVSIAASDATASESGNSGLFTVTRTADPSLPLTVNFTVSGTASNGTRYAFIPASLTVPSGESYATITVSPIFDTIAQGNQTVTLTIATNSAYNISSSNSASVTIADFDDNSRPIPTNHWSLAPTARTGRFVRGTGSDPTYHSFVIPVELEKGVPLDDSGGNASNLFAVLPWSTALSHFNATNGSRFSFQNPIVAFGGHAGGSPLYFDQPYTFGVYAGDPSPTSYTNSASYTNALRIQVYQQGTMASVGTVIIPIPNPAWTNDWIAFVTNGYTKTVTGFGLTTTLTFNQGNNIIWDANPDVGHREVAYHLLHSAAQGATNYVYLVELAGGTSAGWTVVDGSSARSWSRLYTLEFETHPAWRAIVLDRPNFQGLPMPPAYLGRSPDELATNSLPVTNVVSVPNSPSTYTNLDQSPELRRHPILDQFVTDMGKDPLLLANYVLNEIELSDGIDYSESGSISETAINPGGVSRGALGTFLEGQGSPVEQCALLVYLLRQANVPAVYLFPPHNGLQMVDSRLSTLLRMQIRGAVREDGTQYTTNRFIPVNYPWVAAYIGTNWVHIFPWLKDTEVIEGFDLHDFLPAAMNTPYEWTRAYIYGSSNLLSLSRESDTPRVLYPKWLEKTLLENAPGMALDDFGIRFRNRPQYRSRWTDFPVPTYVTNSNIAVESLGSWGITNVSPSLTNIFDTVSVEVSSVANPGTKVSSGELRLAELNDRRFLIRHEKISTNSTRLVLSLAAFRTNLTAIKDFSTITQVFPPNTNALNYLVSSNTLGSSDDLLQVTIVHKWHRSMPSGFSPPDPDDVYLGYYSDLVVTNIRAMNKGDFAAICLNMGRVTKKMLDVHAQDIWQLEQQIATTPSTTNSLSPDRYLGSLLYLMGMSYFEKNDRFRQFIAPLHKANILRSHASGLAGLVAKRDANGLLPDGEIILVQPKVDMFYQEMAVAAGSAFHAESGDASYNDADRWLQLFITAGSAEEHGIINTFFKRSDSISTVKLLRLALSQTTNGIIELNRYNYVTEGDKTYPASSTNKLKDIAGTIWTSITNRFTSAYSSNNVQVFITPGKIRNLSSSYLGLGALMFSPNSYAALISKNFYGGYGENLPDESFAVGNLDQTRLQRDENDEFEFQSTLPSSATPTLLAGSDTAWNHELNYDNIGSGASVLDPSQTTELDSYKLLSGESSSQRKVQYDEMEEDGPLAPTLKPLIESVSDPVNAVAGDFYADDLDLVLPGPMPLQVRRNYSSQNVFDGDLGYGWKLSYFPYLSLKQNGSTISCAEVDGSVVTYRTNSATVYVPEAKDNPRLQNLAGSIANLFGSKITKLTTNSVTTYTQEAPDGSKRVYRVRTFPISTLTRSRPYLESWTDSRGNFLKFYYGTNTYVTDYGKVSRVEANNGNFLNLDYDVYGHITDARTGDGRHIQYEYDTYGDLIRVTRPDASEIEYEYEHRNYVASTLVEIYSTHLLVRERKPEGRVLQNAYDAQRRVVQQYATVGYDLRLVRNASFVYSNNFNLTNYWTNLITGYTLITDYRTNTSRYDYTNSLMRRVTDPLNRVTIQDWYSATDTNVGAFKNSLKSTTDPRGLQTTRYYDATGNLTNSTVRGDLTGGGDTNETAVTLMEYNTNRLVTRVIDPVGNYIVNGYTNATSPYLRTTEERFASNGTSVALTVLTYHEVTNAPPPGLTNFVGSFGLLRRSVRAAGTGDAATNEWLHDAHGFKVQEIRYTGTGDPNVTNTLFYNLRGELVESTDAAGRATRWSYDGGGRVETREVFDESGRRISGDYSYYNENGELTWSDGPRFDPEDYVWRDYDGAGRQIQEIHWRSQAKVDGSGVEAPGGDALFSTSFLEYDAFGDLIKTIDPRGHYQRMDYDAAGQLVQHRVYDALTGQALATSGLAYEPGGKVTRSTNALGAVTETLYTSGGLPRFRRDADGSTNGWLYYLDGRIRREFVRNGSYSETTYDDPARKTIRTFRSTSGSSLATNIAELDRRGNTIRTVDAAGSNFTNYFDGLDRLKWSVGPRITFDLPPGIPQLGDPPPPVQHALTNVYDAAGLVLTNINGLGEKTITWFDALQRATRSEIRSTNGTLVRETTTGYAANHHSVTVTNGSGAGAIVSTVFTDNDGHTVLAIAYPNSSAWEFTRSEFDLAGNLASQTHSSLTNNSRTDWTVASYSYDGLNRLRSSTDRDNALTTFDYDSLGNVTNRVMPGGLKWRAEFNTASQMLKSYNLATNNAGTRTNLYTYFSSGSPFAGLRQTSTDGRGVVCTYSFDAVLRPVTNTYTGPLPEHNLTTVWQYDARGLPTKISESFTNSSIGPSTVVQRSYDPYGLLFGEQVYLNGAAHSLAGQTWDSAGRRKQIGFGEFGFSFGWQADGQLATVAAGSLGGYGANGSYTHTTAGLLSSRNVNGLTVNITSRDGTGRILGRTVAVNSSTRLTETLSWTGDGLLAAETLARSDYTDSRSYDYVSQSRRLAVERLKLDASKGWTNVFQYDAGGAGGAGVLTKVAEPQAGGSEWTASLDVFNRVERETNNVVRRMGYGRVNASNEWASVSASLDGQPLPLNALSTGDANWPVQWRTVMELRPGTHTLQAVANHSSGMFTTNTSVSFTNTAVDQTTLSHFAEGQLSYRVWKNNAGQTNRVQSFTWDARGRMIGTSELDAGNNGYNWSAVYDALGRRLQTSTIIVTNGVALNNQPKTISSFFDPEVEFLELGVGIGGKTTWKVYGPDSDGRYGGMNGTGGLDGLVNDLYIFRPVIADASGDVHGLFDVATTTVNWNSSRPTGYGAVPEYRPMPLADNGNLAVSSAWNGRWPDISGMYWLGARYYDPVAGRFISCDPYGHDGDPGLYGYANGDPINHFDPDGRLAARNTYVGTENVPPPYELGIAPYMVERLYTDYLFKDGTSTGLLPPDRSILIDPDMLAGYNYANVREPTGEEFMYVRDTRDFSVLDNPNYGLRTETYITRDDIEQQQRLEFLKAVPMLLAYADGAGALLEGMGVRMLGSTLTAERGLAGSIRNVNPTGGGMNCVNCAIAGDATLAGNAASALPGGATSIGVLERTFGGTFQPVSGPMQIGSILSQGGNGARGIVFGESLTAGQPGHVFNVINQGGTIRFLDAQAGGLGVNNFNNLQNFRFLPTNP